MDLNIPKPELPAIGIFSNLTKDDLRSLADLGQFHRIKPGSFLIQEDVDQNRLYFVISGSLSIRRAKTKAALAQMGPGDSIGEINIFDPDVASASVVATDECHVWGIDREGLNTFLGSGAPGAVAMLVGLIHVVSHRIRTMNFNLEEARGSSPPPQPGVSNWLD